ncbi:MAG: DeoR/GlpR family DNA-binding transcription regulator [Solobacterium sp.]|jgi:DeoR/GlpR family transcriptional regulator of sugar metabolism|nr:DeoR/GlpR family DNA-binding transcription regulator [Solobacterium sp.]
MLKVDRQNRIEHELLIKGSVTISECVELLGVSEETVRRDYREMEKANRLTRIHGGAYIQESDDKNVPIHLREVLYLDEKRKISQYAVSHFINENDTIMLDSSTTCCQLAKLIFASAINVTIITNSLKIMEMFDGQQSNAKLIAIGGKYRNKSCSFVGDLAGQEISSYLADKCFVSTSALDLKHGMIDSSSQECFIHKKLIENSRFHYLLADYTKFSSRADYIVASFKELNAVITDQKPDEEWIDIFETHGIELNY